MKNTSDAKQDEERPSEDQVDYWVKHQKLLYRRGELSREKQLKLEAIPGWGWDREEFLERNWYQRLSEYKGVYEKLGHIPTMYEDGGDDVRRFASWVAEQKRSYRCGLLSTEKQKAIEESFVDWRWQSDPETVWERNLSDAIAFKAQHGGMPRCRGELKSERFLANWLSRQRMIANGSMEQSRQLTEGQKDRLKTAFGDEWYWDQEELWDRKLEQVARVVHDLKRIPTKTDEGEARKAFDWLATQKRKKCHPRYTPLTEQQCKMIECTLAPYWRWEGETWDDKFNRFADWFKTHRRLPRAQATDEAERVCGMWIRGIRSITAGTNPKRTPLTKDQRARLSSLLGSDWELNSHKNAFDTQLDAAREFFKAYNRLPGDRAATTGLEQKVATWIKTQRQKMRRTTKGAPLSSAQIASIDAVFGGQWRDGCGT